MKKEMEDCQHCRRQEELQKAEERIKKPQIMPKRNILRTYVTRLWNFKEEEFAI
jgi:hypothetical protein